MNKTKHSLRRFLALALTALMLIPCVAGAIPLSAADTESGFALEDLATVLVKGGTFKEIKACELLFSNKTHAFADTVPEYLIGKEYLYKSMGGANATVKTSGYVYVLTESSGTNSQVTTLTEAGFEEVNTVSRGVLSTTLKSAVSIFAKKVAPGETISYETWGILVADLIASENELYEKPLAEIETNSGEIITATAGTPLFLNRPTNHLIADTAPEWFLGKTYLQKSDINGSTTFTVKKGGYVFIMVETTNSKGVKEALVEYGFEVVGTVAKGTLGVSNEGNASLNREINVYAKNTKSGDTFTFSSWGIVVADKYEEPALATLTAYASEKAGVVEAGTEIFNDRPDTHLFADTMPEWLIGKPYVQGSCGSGAILTVKTEGYVYVATPSADQGSKSQVDELTELGFTVHSTLASKTLSSTLKEPLTVMVKYVAVGELIEYGDWAITFASFEPYEDGELISLTPPNVIHNPSDEEYLDGSRNWQGIPGITKDNESGRLWATWYSGGYGEGNYNFVVLYTSDDDGNTWKGPMTVIDHPNYPVRAFDPNLWIDPDGRMWLIWSQSYGHDDGIFGTWMMYTDNPGNENPTWSEPTRVANGIAMNDPIVLSSGEWILPTAIWYNSPHIDSMDSERFSNAYVSMDKGLTWSYLGSVPSYEGDRSCDENMIIELPNGTLRMLIRTKGGIEESYSYDKGVTWTGASDADISNVVSRFYIANLASGNQILIYNDPPENGKDRSHMTVALSTDSGATFPYKLIIDERLSTSYPDAYQDADGNIYVIYDHTRGVHGEILMAKITEADIMAGKLVTDGSVLKKLVNNNYSSEQAEITGSSLSLGSDLSLKFYLKATDEVIADNALSMSFTMNGKSTTVTNYTEENGVYVFVFSNIAPQQMTDVIDAVAYVGSTPVATFYGHSVKNYFVSLLSMNAAELGISEEKHTALKALAFELLRYGEKAQLYKNYATHRLATAGIEGLVSSDITPDASEKLVITGNRNEMAFFKSANVKFDTKNVLAVSICVNAADLNLVKITVNGEEIALSSLEALGNNVYRFTSKELAPSEFDDVYTLSLSFNGEITATLECSVNSYAYGIYNGGSQNTVMGELALALYRYGVATEAYNNAQ